MNILYIYVSPSGKEYIGVTKRLRRRMYEHKRSDTPFGKALRKYGEAAFKVRLFEFESKEDAYRLEELLVTEEQVKGLMSYNQCLGGIGGNTKTLTNPLKTSVANRQKQSEFMKCNNPMNNQVSRDRRKEAMNTTEYKDFHRQLTIGRLREDKVFYHKSMSNCVQGNLKRAKRVQCADVCFTSVADAAYSVGITRSSLRDRLNSTSEKWKDYFYV